MEQNIHWYPGHMTKAKRMMQEDIKLVDLIIELVDARAPKSSRNPDIDEIGRNKARVILLNKADLADERYNDAWNEYFKGKGYLSANVNSRTGAGIRTVTDVIRKACAEKKERDRRRGILNRPVRAMVAGIPNVGKSTFINSLAGKACTKTGNKPGVTKGKQWIKLNKDVELLDTPGILWPKIGDPKVGMNLALIGSIKEEILQAEDLAAEAIRFLKNYYPDVLSRKYGIIMRKTDGDDMRQPAFDEYPHRDDSRDGRKTDGDDMRQPAFDEYPHLDESRDGRKTDGDAIYEYLRQIAENRHLLLKGNGLDTEKAARILLEELRNGKLGRITLEFP